MTELASPSQRSARHPNGPHGDEPRGPFPWRRGAALFPCLLLLVVAACGGGDGAPPPARVCPGAVRTDVLLGGIRTLNGCAYTIRADRTRYEIHGRGGSRFVDTTLTKPLEVALGTHEGVSVLHVVGCREDELVWVTFGARGDDGVLDDLLGELVLPACLILDALTCDLAHGATLAYAPSERSILRFTDRDGDLVPDGITTLATHSAETPIVPVIREIRFEPGGVLLCGALDLVGPMDPVTVVTDADRDGSPESVVTLPIVLHRQPRPQFVLPPRADETEAQMFGIPGTTIELWCVDEAGTKLSSEPASGRLGRTTLPTSSATGTITLSRALRAGEHVALFDARPDTIPGPTTQVSAPYPIVSSIAPDSIDGSQANTLTVSGSRFAADTRVRLTLDGPREVLDLIPSVQSATTLTVEVPILGPEWRGSAHLRAYNANSPVHEIGRLIIVHR